MNSSKAFEKSMALEFLSCSSGIKYVIFAMPYDLNDIACDLPNTEERRDEIIKAITEVNYGKKPQRVMREELFSTCGMAF